MMSKILSLINQPQDFRFERKYWFEENQIFSWKSLINLLPVQTVYPQRQVNSLYFDNKNLKFYHAAKNGDFSRYKVRIRWYGNLYTKKTKAQLEIKFKQGELASKKIFLIKNFSFSKKIHKNKLKKKIIINLPEQLKELLKSLDFILITVYDRQYWQAYANSLRVTVDTGFKTAFHFNQTNFNHDLIKQPFEVLELKYPNKAEEQKLAKHIGQQLPLQLTRFSKYAWGIERSL